MAKPVQLESGDSWLGWQLRSNEVKALERSGVDLIAPVEGGGSNALIVIVRQLCAGLSAAHRCSLIHRDLKPENIFLCEREAELLVKILDFGLAKLFLESQISDLTGTFSTVTGQIAGTPAYMSPELLSGAKPD